MGKKLLIIFAILGIVVPIVVIFFSKTSPNPPPTPLPAPVKNNTTTLGGLVLCKDFPKIEGEITCDDAIRIATTKYPGIVREVFPENNFRFSSSDETGRDLWRLEIKLNIPIEIDQATLNGVRLFLDRKSGKELGKRYRTIP